MSQQKIKTLLERINTRNILAILFGTGYFIFLFYSVERGLTQENPIITVLLGVLSSALILIVQFYFRRAEPS